MLGTLLLDNVKELELVMINMTNNCLETMNHMRKQWCNILALPLAISATTTDNITTIYRVDHRN